MCAKQTLPNLRKAQSASLHWTNQYGDTRALDPRSNTHFTLHNTRYSKDEKLVSGANAFDYAVQHKIIDEWTPVFTCTFAANHSFVCRGTRALKMWKSWQAVVFGNKK